LELYFYVTRLVTSRAAVQGAQTKYEAA